MKRFFEFLEELKQNKLNEIEFHGQPAAAQPVAPAAQIDPKVVGELVHLIDWYVLSQMEQAAANLKRYGHFEGEINALRNSAGKLREYAKQLGGTGQPANQGYRPL